MTQTTPPTTDVVVIGAGLTGLTTAYYLQKNQKEFLVLEKQTRIGGVIHSTCENGFLYENVPNTGGMKVFKALDVKVSFNIESNNHKLAY